MAVRLCFLFYGDLEEQIAQVMMASVRNHMPDMILTQLTDAKTKRIKGVDEVLRIDGKTYPYLLLSHMANCPLPFIRVDYDMIFQGDLSPCLQGDFDIAVNGHGDDFILQTEFGRMNPLATCVWAANNGTAHDFAREVRKTHMTSGRDNWLGLVTSCNEVLPRYKVKELDGRIYNYCPKEREDRPEDVLVLHYKGNRKQWMFPKERAHLANKDQMRLMALVKTYGQKEHLARGA